LVLALVLASCGGVGAGVGSTTAAPPVATTMPAASTTSTATSPTTVMATSTTGQEIDVYFEGGQVVGPEVFSFVVGDAVSIWLLSDADEEVHVHGYDISIPVKADVPLEISLTADVPGIFEVELETSRTLLFELEVTP
jgi:hypothetical protein